MVQEDRRVLRAHKDGEVQQVLLWVHTVQEAHKVRQAHRVGKEQRVAVVLMVREDSKALRVRKVFRVRQALL